MTALLIESASSNDLPKAVLQLISGEFPGVARSAGVFTIRMAGALEEYKKTWN